MKIIKEIELKNFEFWSGAKDNAGMLTIEELEQLDEILDNERTETEINDLFRFDFGYICELIGLEYDEENNEIIRD